MSDIKEKKPRATTPIAKYPDKPTRVIAIDGEYIREFFKAKYEAGEISSEELLKWSDLTKELIEAKGDRGYFQPLRKEFVKAFFPELLDIQPLKKEKESMADFLKGLVK